MEQLAFWLVLQTISTAYMIWLVKVQILLQAMPLIPALTLALPRVLH